MIIHLRESTILKSKKGILLLACFFLLIVFYGYLKIIVFRLDDLRTFTDTNSYTQAAMLPIFSLDFWFGNRAPLLPLFYKLLGGNLSTYTTYQFMHRVTHFQLLTSILSWIFLGLAVSRQFSHLLPKIVSFAVVLLFDLSLEISFWDKIMLSESFSNNLFAILLGIAFLYSSIKGSKNNTLKIVYIISASFFSILYCLIRDSNVILLILYWVVCVLFNVIFNKKRKKCSDFSTYFLIFYPALFLVIFSSIIVGNRSNPGLVYSIGVLAGNSEYSKWFQEKGINISGLSVCAPDQGKESSRACNSMLLSNTQLLKQIRLSYPIFLLENPKYLFVEPFTSKASVLSPSSLEYRYSQKEVPHWLILLTNIMTPLGTWIYVIGLVLLGIIIVLNRKDHNPFLFLVTFLFLSTFIMGIVIWHGDKEEIERHAQQNLLQSRLSIWLMLIWVIDAISRKIKTLQNNF